jgi:hypothetical protein
LRSPPACGEKAGTCQPRTTDPSTRVRIDFLRQARAKHALGPHLRSLLGYVNALRRQPERRLHRLAGPLSRTARRLSMKHVG